MKNRTSLYIHIPFCAKKCFYCSFAVSVGQSHRVNQYLECLAAEAARYPKTPVASIYIGGGTPTFLKNHQLQKLFEIIRSQFLFNNKTEITIEANPDDLDFKKAKSLKACGINRVSLGVQSLNNRVLKYLGRIHDRDTALKAFENLQRAGFKNKSVDIMFSLPQQTKEDITRDIKGIAALEPEHCSLYALDIEANSRFFAQKIKLDNDRRRARHYQWVVKLLGDYGFQQYEVSNFAKPGKASIHNLNYWTGGNYIGLGLAAHSHKDGRRYWNFSRLQDYMKTVLAGRLPIEGEEVLTKEERLMETLLLSLRTANGVDVEELQKRMRCLLTPEKKTKIQELIKGKFLIQRKGRLTATPNGRLVLEEISARLI